MIHVISIIRHATLTHRRPPGAAAEEMLQHKLLAHPMLPLLLFDPRGRAMSRRIHAARRHSHRQSCMRMRAHEERHRESTSLGRRRHLMQDRRDRALPAVTSLVDPTSPWSHQRRIPPASDPTSVGSHQRRIPPASDPTSLGSHQPLIALALGSHQP